MYSEGVYPGGYIPGRVRNHEDVDYEGVYPGGYVSSRVCTQ